MIYIHRTTNVIPSKIREYNELVQKFLLLMEKYGVKLVGSWQTTIGESWEYTHLTMVEDLATLQKNLRALTQDQEYQKLQEQMSHLITRRVIKILSPTEYSPLK